MEQHEIADEVNKLVKAKSEIHFHTFSMPSYRKVIEKIIKEFTSNLQILEIINTKYEVISVLQKK